MMMTVIMVIVRLVMMMILIQLMMAFNLDPGLADHFMVMMMMMMANKDLDKVSQHVVWPLEEICFTILSLEHIG